MPVDSESIGPKCAVFRGATDTDRRRMTTMSNDVVVVRLEKVILDVILLNCGEWLGGYVIVGVNQFHGRELELSKITPL